MNFSKRLFFFIPMVFLLVSCNKIFKQEVLPGHIRVGDSYYTQFVIRYEKNRHVTTNYRRGASIPINTKVTLREISGKTIELDVPNMSAPLLIKHIQKHTGDDLYQIFDKLFGEKPVNLGKFNSVERANIIKGNVAKGMSKDAVIAAIGYPPITETPGLKVDRWVYWSGRFNRFIVHFRNNRVNQIED